jgi:hypothetical protein
MQQYNSCMGMTPDPSSLAKGLACQTNTHSGKLCLRPGTPLWLAWAATPQLGIRESKLLQPLLMQLATHWKLHSCSSYVVLMEIHVAS